MLETRESYHISLKLLLKNSEGKILVLTSLSTGTFGGYHDFPGGRIEQDEFNTPILDILKREVEEETGITDFIINPNPVSVGRHLILSKHTIEKNKDVPVFYVFYEGACKTENVIISEEHEGAQWLDLREIELDKYFNSGILEGVKAYLNR